MNVSLTPELARIVEGKVSSGLYNSASEVIRAALRLMVEDDRLRNAKLDALRKDIALGIKQLDSGHYTEYDEKSATKLIKQIKSRKKK